MSVAGINQSLRSGLGGVVLFGGGVGFSVSGFVGVVTETLAGRESGSCVLVGGIMLCLLIGSVMRIVFLMV
ncbi:MAG: hypothetical protein CO093_02755 [Alphaproteobacteria bacterium CG_4_9_14_3_um_filter_47_13]|nr:MAG: hypothetical protein CO093_02755 [Alphaproteobacteria bacterium CG_4_9_14_3_um_filter_47_13]